MIGTLNEGDIIGAAEFVLAAAGEITYVTDTVVETVGFVVDVLRVLFVNKPEVCARFHRFIAMSLAALGREMSTSQQEEKE